MNRWNDIDLQPGSEDPSFKRLVITILVILGGLLLATVVFDLVTYEPNRIILLVAAAFVFGAMVLAIRGILLPARILIPFVLYIALVVVNVFGNGNGIFDSAMIGLASVVILAGLFLGKRGALSFGILVTTTIFLMGLLDALGIYNPKRPTSASPADIAAIVFVAIANSSLIYLFIQRLTEIASRARHNEELQVAANRDLKELQTSLEERVVQRTSDLERRSVEFATIAELTRNIITIRDLGTMLNLAADLIRQRLGYYHVGIFLVDERSEYAVLRAASSEAAKSMLDSHHKLKIGEVGLVGYVASTSVPRIALDVGADAVHFKNPFLPETRSEIALPLRSRSFTIGVLDIQAKEASAFSEENIQTLQLLADQLVSAIENAQLVDRAEATLKELNATYQAQTRKAWQKSIQEYSHAALEYDGLQMKPVPHHLPDDALEQLEHGKAVVLHGSNLTNNGDNTHRSSNTLVVPLMVLNQMIGVIGLEQDEPDHTWTVEEIAVAEAAASRTAIALENARLLQDAQTRAAKEQTIGEISARIGSLIDLDSIIQTTIQELGRNVPDAEVAIQLGVNK